MAEDFVKQLYDFVDGSVRHHLESPDNLKEFLTYLAGMRTDVPCGTNCSHMDTIQGQPLSGREKPGRRTDSQFWMKEP